MDTHTGCGCRVVILAAGLSIAGLGSPPVAAQSEGAYVSRHIDGERVRSPLAGDPVAVALEFARQSFDALGVLPSDVRDLEVRSHHTSAHNGVTHVSMQQVVGGIDACGGDPTGGDLEPCEYPACD